VDVVFRALRPVLFCLAAAVPAVVLRLSGAHLSAPLAIVVFGLGVVAASFVLAWAAEAAEVDISGGLAIPATFRPASKMADRSRELVGS
jgi:cation:H+ antiporter